LSQIEPAGPFRDVCDDQRRQDAKNSSGQAIQQLDDYKQRRIRGQRKEPGANRNDTKPDEQKWPTSPGVGRPSYPWRQQSNDDLWDHD